MTIVAGPKLIGLDAVLDDPHGVAANLPGSDTVHGLSEVEVRIADATMVTFRMTLAPWHPMAVAGYPAEQVSITVWAQGRIAAVPFDASRRSWEHKNPFVFGRLDHLGELCLWYPMDSRSLRWEWEDGFASYVTVVHRHLQAEEFFRRYRRWPAEDAPHGPGPHPVRTLAVHALGRDGAA